MSLNHTPTANRLHIALFGRRNSGKSSLINALTGQDAALVSDIPGTTTDPVSKAMNFTASVLVSSSILRGSTMKELWEKCVSNGP